MSNRDGSRGAASSDAAGSPREREKTAAPPRGPASARPTAEDRDEAEPRATGVPVGDVVELTPPAEVARQALNRAKAAARAKGLRPGQEPRRRILADPPTSGARPGGRDPQLLGDVVAHLLRERDWVADVSVGGVVGRWREVVGDQVADHCEPETFEDKVLVVRADSTAWATQVRLLAPQLLERLAREVGEGVVETVTVLGPAGPSFRRGRKSVRGPGPRDTWG
ncbi:putative nucleic acid-binding Zn ribbon protein [Cellulosimicrobium cellulans]|nr:putative nucleic acid-binding Zn ribbon protein [Cellulosimicrobium cellulans]